MYDWGPTGSSPDPRNAMMATGVHELLAAVAVAAVLAVLPAPTTVESATVSPSPAVTAARRRRVRPPAPLSVLAIVPP
ncbi:hypothetical protein GCM10009737_16740 [Nocardioides lentus]|uniref:Secreted protein n=1 Tax=Nocardioides lentus TaxID=338077 RepID=A0ABP5AJY1_9ACTN